MACMASANDMPSTKTNPPEADFQEVDGVACPIVVSGSPEGTLDDDAGMFTDGVVVHVGLTQVEAFAQKQCGQIDGPGRTDLFS
jgi:hypothetical protein